MSTGWIRVVVPESLQEVIVWRVRIGDAMGRPGEPLAAPEGDNPVKVEAELALPALWAAARLEVTVNVTGGRTTGIHIPLLLPWPASGARYSPPS
jgi:hypothetical protein